MTEPAGLVNPEERTAERIARTHQYTAAQDTVKNIASAKLAHHLLDAILAGLKPGMVESEVKQMALDLFAAQGIEKTWHPPYVRFGEHTLLTFQDKAEADRVLAEVDIAFVDIGIVFDGIEGDAGRTVHFGGNPLHARLQAASESIFHDARDFWKQTNPTGIALYEYIHDLARKAGFAFCLDPAGHLIGEFPHRGWKRGINHFPEPVEAGKWILEIQVRHPELPVASFYENLLY
jgi:methionine aminopeptidase